MSEMLPPLAEVGQSAGLLHDSVAIKLVVISERHRQKTIY
jgi:hypothetical protein